MNEPRNKWVIKKTHPISIRFDVEEIELLDKVVSKFKKLNRSDLIRLACEKFCNLVLYEGKLEITMEENGDEKI